MALALGPLIPLLTLYFIMLQTVFFSSLSINVSHSLSTCEFSVVLIYLESNRIADASKLSYFAEVVKRWGEAAGVGVWTPAVLYCHSWNLHKTDEKNHWWGTPILPHRYINWSFIQWCDSGVPTSVSCWLRDDTFSCFDALIKHRSVNLWQTDRQTDTRLYSLYRAMPIRCICVAQKKKQFAKCTRMHHFDPTSLKKILG